MIDLELYRIFYVVAENKNITKASEILNISQPAVTKHIQNLENQLGTPLFIRTKKGVVLNDAGKKIYLKVKNALTILDEVEREIYNINEMNKGTIKIGTSTSLVKKYLLYYIEEFHKLYPNIVITIFTDPTKELIGDLKSGQIDMIIAKEPKQEDLDLEYAHLGTTSYMFVANDKYKELRDKKVSIEELSKYPFLFQKNPSNARTSVENYFKNNGYKIDPKMNIGSASLVSDFASIGYGIGYATELYVENYISKGKLFKINVDPEPEKIDFGLITLKNNVLPSYINKFIGFLKEGK